MPVSHLTKAGIFAAIIVILSFTGWELYLRSKISMLAYDDTPGLWSKIRKKATLPKEKSTVFIGSSRIKYDLDQPTWRALTGEEPVQLAIEGATPIPVLKDLAEDEHFKGKLVVDVTEILFFNNAPPVVQEPVHDIKYFHNETPSEKFSFAVNRYTDGNLYFLDQNNFSLNAMLEKLEVPSRKGVFVFPWFPPDFNRTDFDRQARMTDRFLIDTAQQHRVQWIWKYLGDNGRQPPLTGEKLTAFLLQLKQYTDKIKARGGEVIFTRTPSSGPFLQGERMGYPKEKYWNSILAATGCAGIHFEDDSATVHMQCLEFSHLTPTDAKRYTTALVRQLQQKGWHFNNTATTTAQH
jgi:hypothetical protein